MTHVKTMPGNQIPQKARLKLKTKADYGRQTGHRLNIIKVLKLQNYC